MIREYSSVRRYDPPLPATEDYSQVSVADDLILHYLQWLWFSTTSEILLEHQTIYSDYLPNGRCFLLAFACYCCCWVLRAKNLEPSTSRAKSPPSPLLSKKKDKSTEKRESEPRRRNRVLKSSKDTFWYSVFRRKNSSLLCWVLCAFFFVSGGRLLNRNVSDDVWASLYLLLSLDFS